MDDVKSTYREGEQGVKDAMRNADGDESLTDKLGNAGDEIRKQAGNVGDQIDKGVDQATDASKADARAADGDDSLADAVGNAGDDLRRTVEGH